MNANTLLGGVLLGAAALLAPLARAASPAIDPDTYHAPTVKARALLFDRNSHGSRFYRIPALATANDGTLVAVADKRIDSNADLPGRIDVVCRTSADGGRTWTEQATIAANDAEGGFGDPLLVVDRPSGDILCLATHAVGLWDAKQGASCGRIYLWRSKDSGRTWSEGTDITDQFFSNDPSRPAPVVAKTGFASSGGALQTREGRIMFVFVANPMDSPRYAPLDQYVVYSDDGGRTWTSSGQNILSDGNESKIAQLADGTLLMSIRNSKKGQRLFSTSSDGGLTWTPPQGRPELVEPGCNGDLLALDRPSGRWLVQSLVSDPAERRNVTLFASRDGGDTWAPVQRVCPFPSAYSALTELPDGSIGVLAEEAANDGGYRLWFTAYDLSDTLK